MTRKVLCKIEVKIDPAVLERAEAAGVNLSRAAEIGIAQRTVEALQWQEENAEAIRSSNEYVAKHGLPLAKYRQF